MPQLNLVPVFRYFQEGSKDHFLTIHSNEIGTETPGAVGQHGYKFEGIAFHVSRDPAPGLVPIYRYWKAAVSDHHYTTDPNEMGATQPGQQANHGYVCEGIMGYIHKDPAPGTVPVHRYFHGGLNDHFFTTSVSEIGVTGHGVTGNHGFVAEGVLGHAFQK